MELKILNLKNRIYEKTKIIKNNAANIALFFIVLMFIFLSITGIRPMYVMSESMEPVINKHSIILAKKIKEDEKMKVGGIYTYKDPARNYTITHRIIGMTEGGSYIFKGDNNEFKDPVVERNWIMYEVLWYPRF